MRNKTNRWTTTSMEVSRHKAPEPTYPDIDGDWHLVGTNVTAIQESDYRGIGLAPSIKTTLRYDWTWMQLDYMPGDEEKDMI